MSIKHELQLAYVLHSRAFRETSLLVEMFSQEYGRIALVARGAKAGKHKTSNILQPFMPLIVSWYGNGELVTLTNVEPAAVTHDLYGKRAICGLYINELLIKLLPKFDPCLQLFTAYQQALQDLAQEAITAQISLRKFEKELLKSIGYGLQLTKEINSGAHVQEDQYYLFDPILGPRLASNAHPAAIKGQSLWAIAQDLYDCEQVLADAKRLMRLVFTHHLGARQLMTRELF